jgi:hypothetical protein
MRMSDTSANPGIQGSSVLSRWLFNPFYYIAGGKALAIGIVVMLITGLSANLGRARFNGLLDFHIDLQAQPFWINISEILISWLVFSCLLLVSGKIVSKSRVRFIDVFGTQALARFPYLLASMIAFIPATHRFIQKLATDLTALERFSPDMIPFIVAIIFVLLMLAWMVTLMYRAFSISCNITGKKAISVFIAALIVGEILSRVVLHYGALALPDQTPELSSRAGELVTLFSEEEYAGIEEMFDKTMKEALPAEKLEELWKSLIVQTGPFRTQGQIRKTEYMGYDIVYVPCQFEKTTLDCQIAFDSEGSVSGLFFRPAADN